MKAGRAFLIVVIVIAFSLLAVGGWMRMQPDVEMGARLVENNCGVCHDLGREAKNEKGPYLWGILNRPAGSAVGYDYSSAFMEMSQSKSIIWNEENLERFITDPNQFIPQTRMAQHDAKHPLAFDGIQSSANRRDVIAYLKTLR